MLRSQLAASSSAARAARRALHSKPGGTFARQAEVPRLPLPELNATATRYLKSLEPLLSKDDYKVSEAAVNTFVQDFGPELQRRLHDVDKAAPYSWLEDIWLKKAYLEYRGPSFINVNWAALIGDNPTIPIAQSVAPEGVTDIQLSRASNIITHLLEQNEALNDQTFRADEVRGQPLDMDQFKWQFGTTRLPKPNCDELVHQYPSTAKHILVMYRDHAVEVPVYAASGARASPDQIADQLRLAANRVDDQIASAGPTPSVANLTSADRDLWTKARASLEADPVNQTSLASVDSALFGVCLDTELEPEILNDIQKTWAQYMHTDYTGANRWFDKAIQLVFLPNGRMGANCEHTPVDALTTGRLLYESLKKETQPLPDVPHADGLAAPEPLKWNISNDVAHAITQARADAAKLAHDLRCLLFSVPDLGSKWIKTLGVGPDAFYQVAIQAAYLRQHGKPCATYESANLRKFLHGRTETIRSCTSEAQAFAQVLDDKDVPADKKMALFTHACKTHSALTAAASNGEGIDRHLLGLRAQIRPGEEERATLFADPAYALSSFYPLSTSNTTPGDYFRGGFGPVVHHGYGINYAIDPTDIKMQLSEWISNPATDAARFKETMEETLKDVQKLGLEVLANK